MKTKITRANIIQSSLILLLIVLSVLLISDRKNAKKGIENEKIKYESLLSDKLNVQKNLSLTKEEIESLSGKNNQLDKQLNDLKNLILEKENEIRHLSASNSSMTKLKSKITELENFNEKLNKQIADINSVLKQTQYDNKSMQELLDKMKKENDKLLASNIELQSILADNFRVEALKGKEKPTIKANRTNKIAVSFDLPENYADPLSFSLITPSGDEIKDIKGTTQLIGEDITFLASLDFIPDRTGTKRTGFTYKPSKKLEKGVYKINVYKENQYLGSTQLRLK